MADSFLRADFMDLLRSPRPGDELAAFIKARPRALVLMDRADQIPAGPIVHHSGSTLAHLARCMNEVRGDPVAVWMALCHDAGKLNTPAALYPHHYNHETRGEIIAGIWAKALNLPPEYAEAGALASREHMKAGLFRRLRPGKKLALLETVSDSPWPAQFWNLVNADTKSRLGDILRRFQEINDRAREMSVVRDYRIAMIREMTADL